MSRWRSDVLKLIAPETELVYELGFSDPDTPGWRKLAIREELGQLILHVLAVYMQTSRRTAIPVDVAVHALDCFFVITGRSELAISWSEELKAAEIAERLARLDPAQSRLDQLLAATLKAEIPYVEYDQRHGRPTAMALRRLVVVFAMSLALLENVDLSRSLHQDLAAVLLPNECFDREFLRRRLESPAKAKPDEFIWMPDPNGTRASARVYFIRKQEGDEVEPGDDFGYAYSANGMVPIRCGLRGRIKDIFVNNGDMVTCGRKLASVVLDDVEREQVARWLR